MDTHYERIGHGYDELYSFEDSYVDEQANDIIKWLALEKSCTLADIGGGTGKWSCAILERLHLENSVILEDPSQSMVNVANEKKGITAFCEDVHSFLKKDGLDFNKCLIRAAIHHISDVRTFFINLYAIPSLSKVLILTSPEGMTSYPMFKKAFDTTAKLNVDQTDVIKAAEEAGFNLKKITKRYKVTVPVEKWLECIKRRVFSSLEPLTDDDIKEGQAEIRQRYPGDVIEFEAVWDVIMLNKT